MSRTTMSSVKPMSLPQQHHALMPPFPVGLGVPDASTAVTVTPPNDVAASAVPEAGDNIRGCGRKKDEMEVLKGYLDTDGPPPLSRTPSLSSATTSDPNWRWLSTRTSSSRSCVGWRENTGPFWTESTQAMNFLSITPQGEVHLQNFPKHLGQKQGARCPWRWWHWRIKPQSSYSPFCKR